MSTIIQKQALKVQLLDISPHNQAILEFFFAGAGHQVFQIVKSEDEAHAFISDFDFPGAKEKWESDYTSLGKPVMVIAMAEPDTKNSKWVPKPITSKNMIDAAQSIKELLAGTGAKSSSTATTKAEAAVETKIETKTETPEPVEYKKATAAPTAPRQMRSHKAGKAIAESPFSARPHPTEPKIKPRSHNEPTLEQDSDTLIQEKDKKTAPPSKIASPPKENATHTESTAAKSIDDDTKTAIKKESSIKIKPAEAAKAQERWVRLCGEPATDKSDIYNPENHLQGSIVSALRLAKQTRKVIQIKYEPHNFYMLYDEYIVVSDLDIKSNDYQSLCKTQVVPGQINLHILNSSESSAMKRKILGLKVENKTDSIYSLEAFVWSTCLLSSHGRLTDGCTHDSLFLLRNWPDFTQIEHFPFAMKIAALWHSEPCTLSDISTRIGVSQHYVNSFFNGANGLSLFEEDQKKIKSHQIVKPRKKRGFIARLFGRLTRGVDSA